MRVISLFAGAGGLDLGFRQAGHEVVWANDYDRDCVATYERNLGSHIVLGDVAAVKVEDLPEADLVIGGFPCQGFSRANMRRSGSDERNKLYREFVRIVDGVQPTHFVAENVRGILSLEGGTAFQRILGDFRALNYEVSPHLVNAADYGVPQQRWRVFLVGTRNDIRSEFRPVFPEPRYSRDARMGRHPWVSVGEALDGLPDPDSELGALIANHQYSRYKVTPRNFTGHRLTDPSKPSPTILARGNGGGGVCAIPHPSGLRRMTVRESARVQTFPDDFVFEGALNSCYRQVGNAVPVTLAREIGRSFVAGQQSASVAA